METTEEKARRAWSGEVLDLSGDISFNLPTIVVQDNGTVDMGDQLTYHDKGLTITRQERIFPMDSVLRFKTHVIKELRREDFNRAESLLGIPIR